MSDASADELEALIAELVASGAELASAAHQNAEMLIEVLGVRGQTVDGARRAPADDDASPLAPDVLEIATLGAQAAGVTVQEYLRAAVLAYGAPDGASPASADGALATRAEAARRDTVRVRAESNAVKAQSAQAAARSTQLERRAQRRREAGRDDGDGPADERRAEHG